MTARQADEPRAEGSGSHRLLDATIVNCSSDHNKGAAAISWGLVERLKGSGLVGGVTLIAKSRSFDDLDYRHTRQKFGDDVPLLPSPLATRRRERGPYSVRNAAPLLAATVAIGSRSRRRSLVLRDPAARAISSSDIVFNRGGPFFTVPEGALHVDLRLSWPFLFARKQGVPYALVGEGIGVFGGRLAKAFHRRVFERAALIEVRDELSRQRLVGLGVPEARIRVMLDNAFWVRPRRTPRVDRILESTSASRGGFLAVTIRTWPDAESRYVPALARTVDELVPGSFEQALLVPNTYNPMSPRSGDPELTRVLWRRLAGNPAVHLVDEDLTPEELAALYGRSAVTLGTRLHSVILALVGGAPVVAVSYLPKTHGVMSTLGLDEFVLDMSDYRHDEAVGLVRRATTEQGHVADLLARLRASSDEHLGAFLRRLRDAAPR